MYQIKVRNISQADKLGRIFEHFSIEADIGRPNVSVDIRDTQGVVLLGLPDVFPLVIYGQIPKEMEALLQEFDFCLIEED